MIKTTFKFSVFEPARCLEIVDSVPLLPAACPVRIVIGASLSFTEVVLIYKSLTTTPLLIECIR